MLLSLSLQCTTAATESFYLLLKHCFEDLRYRRVEWKADDLNVASKRAATRLDFVYEGCFRRHMVVVKGRNRDTAWFSVVDEEWPRVEDGLEGWLDRGNFEKGGGQERKLEVARGGLAAE